MSQPPYPGQPNPEQPYPGQPSSGQPSSGQPYPGQPYPGQPYPGQPYPGQPYPGQPSAGQPWQPNPDVPTSIPPQGGFPPGYGEQTGYPVTAGIPQAPKGKSKALPIVLVSIAVLLVLCVGGGTAVFLFARNVANNPNAASTPTAEPKTTAPATSPTTESTPSPAAKIITVVEPKKLGNRPKIKDEQFTEVTDDLKSGMATTPGVTTTISAAYGTPAKRDLVIVTAAAAPIRNPRQEVTGTFFGAGVGGLKITGITTVDPGPLGGAAKCGRAEKEQLVLCAWADEGSLGWVMTYFKSVNQAKKEFVSIRGQIEKSS